MSAKIILNTELNQTSMRAGQMIPLNEYQYENAALLPDSVRHRKKRAGGNEEASREPQTTEQHAPSQKRPRTEYEQLNVGQWSEDDRNMLQNIDPELITKTEHLSSELETNFRNISQDYFSAIIQSLNTLLLQVTGERAKQQLYGKLEGLQDSIEGNPDCHLQMPPLPPREPEISIQQIQPEFRASIRPSKWSNDDWVMMNTKCPELIRDLKQFRHRIRNKKKISQVRLSSLDKRLHELFRSLSSDVAKTEVFSVLEEMHRFLPLMGNPALHLKELPALTGEGAHTESIKHITLNIKEWDEDERTRLSEIYPNFEQKTNDMLIRAVQTDSAAQRETGEFYNTLHLMWDGLKTDMAKNDIFSVMQYIRGKLSDELVIDMNIQPLPQYQFQAIFTVLLHPLKWTLNERHAVENIFPNMVSVITHIKDNIKRHKKISQERLYEAERKLHLLWEHLTSEEARFEVSQTLREIKASLPASGNPELEMKDPPVYKPVPVVIYRPEINFTRGLHPARWLPDEITAVNTIFPSIVKTLTRLRADITQYANISDERLLAFENKCNLIWAHLKGEIATKEFREMYQELAYNVSVFSENRVRFRELVIVSATTWLMTDFTQRNPGMTDTWLAEDKRIQSSVAPSLTHDLRRLATKENVRLDDIEKVDRKLHDMLDRFQGINARATVQSVIDAMYRHFIHKKREVLKNIHIFSSQSSEKVYSEPLHMLKQMADSVTIWVDSVRLRHKHLQGIISKIIRVRFINDKITEIQTREGPSSASQDRRHISLLTRYRDLMCQQTPDSAQRNALIQEIKAEAELSRFIRRVELSLPSHTNQILNEKQGEWGELQHPDQKQNFQLYVDKYRSAELSALARGFILHYSDPRIVTGLPEKIQVRELKDVFKEGALYHRLNSAHYTFDDRDTIVKFLLISEGMQGLFTSEYNPPLSGEIMSLLEQYLGENVSKSASLYRVLQQAAEARLADPEAPFHLNIPDVLQAGQVENYQALTLILSMMPVEQWFVYPEWAVPVLSGAIRFSTDGQSLTDRAFIAGSDNKISQDSSFLHYLELLFNIQQDALKGGLTEEGVAQKLSQSGLTSHITEESIRHLVQGMSGNPWKSLTQINNLLRGSETLAHESLSWYAGRYPVLKCLLPYMNDVSGSGLLFVSEEIAGILHHTEPSQGQHSSDVPKYTLLSWPDFYGSHARLWNEVAATFRATKTEFHPQSLIVSNEGRCMGLTLLYMNAGTTSEYDIVTQNLLTAGGLLQTRDSMHLPLTLQDNKFLNDTISMIDRLQLQGNTLISEYSNQQRMPWSEESLSIFFNNDVNNLLITTPAHTLIIQHFDSLYRVTDPNFGHAEFPSLSDAVHFLEAGIQLTSVLSKYYGLSGSNVRSHLFVYDISNISQPDLSEQRTFSSEVYITSQEKLSLRTEQIILADKNVTWRLLFDIGAYTNGHRINEQTPSSALAGMTIHGDILRDYLSRTVLNKQHAERLRAILYAIPPETGTLPVNPDIIQAVPVDISADAFRFKRQVQKTIRRMAVTVESLSERFSRMKLKKLPVNITLSDIEKGRFSILFRASDGTEYHMSIDVPEIVHSFKHVTQMFSGITDSGIFDFDIGLSIAGIVQYSRLLEQKGTGEILSHLNAVIDIKQLAESTLGSMIQVAGNKFFNPDGLQAFRMETWLANNLRKAASHSGVTLAQALNSCARILELPILETITGVWGLYSSISELQQARHHTEIMSARVRVAFDSISLSLTFASIAFPPLIVAAGPVAAVGMGAVSIAHNVASKEERHQQWMKYRQFLIDGSRNIMTADPENGIIDFSGNYVMGELYLDLRDAKPVLKGRPSFNSNRKIGSCPELNDWQIRQRLGYGYSFMPASSLARGYANTQWPAHIPLIPEGEYSTVIVGYGRQFRANTEIEYLSNSLVWREVIYSPDSRYALPPLEVLNQQCTVICGKNKTTIIPVRILNELTPERIRYARTFKDYTFTFIGGDGGITVQPGGVGIYKIDASPVAEDNVLSFRGLPDSFELIFDLSLETQTVMTNINGEELPVMTISQSGINTIIGSLSGRNRLKGNSLNNTFHTGHGGGEIYSGGGNNRYIIPGKLTSPLSIHLDDDSARHEIILPENDLSHIRADGIHLRMSNGEDITVQEVSPNREHSTSEWLKVYTNDGFMLSPVREGKQTILKISLCDVQRWKGCHPERDSTPEGILAVLHDWGWGLDQEVVFHSGNMSARYIPAARNLCWQVSVDSSEVTFTGHSSCKTTIYGSSGTRYNLRTYDANSAFCIELYGDSNRPEIVDLRELIPGKVTAERDGNTLKLTVHHSEGIVSVDIIYNDNSTETWVYFSPSEMIKLKDIIGLTESNHHSVILYQTTTEISANKVLRIDNLSSITTFIPSISKDKEIILCLENSGWTEKNVKLSLLSGKLKDAINLHKEPLSINVKPSSVEYVIFSGEENVSLTGEISTPPLFITSSGIVSVPEYRWRSVEQIIISPVNDAPTVKLIDFIRYELPLSNEKESGVMYHPSFIRIHNHDLTIKFFYLSEKNVVRTLDITLRNYFTKRIDDISEPEKMIATTPLPDSRLIRQKYHWRLIYMGDTPLSIIGLVSVKNYSKYRMKN
ncbi:TPA: DUF3491 domain-containing protein [Klebsiella pneumoniae]|nr:DUF3491 domain-containing protein [Klebsiella pneumoniae]